MTRHHVLAFTVAAAAAILLAASFAAADDRVLLRAEAAPPNVLIVLDSGASMTHDPETNSVEFLSSGDDLGLNNKYSYSEYLWQYYDAVHGAGALSTAMFGSSPPTAEQEVELLEALGRGPKLPQAKRALQTFFDYGLNFNFGFTYYGKTDIEVHHLNHVYVLSECVDLDANGVCESTEPTQGPMLDGTLPGWPIRMGSKWDARTNNQDNAAPAFYAVRYGAAGIDDFVGDPNPFADNTGTPDNPKGGDRRLISRLVFVNALGVAVPWSAMSESARITDKQYYYPAYEWGSASCGQPHMTISCAHGDIIRSALQGGTTWEAVAAAKGIVMDSQWKEKVRAFAVADIKYHGDPWSLAVNETWRADLEAWKLTRVSNQIGSRILHVWEGYQIYDALLKDWRDLLPAEPGYATQVTELAYSDHFVLYDHDYLEEDPGANTLSSLNYQGTSDCGGYQDEGGNSIPIVPISQIDPVSGMHSNQVPLIKSYLAPQVDGDTGNGPAFYFPDRIPSLPDMYSLPRYHTQFIPMTEPIFAGGRRPIKNTINDADFFFKQVVANWEDPLDVCRMNFMIIITDGIETCTNTTAPCSAASSTGFPIYVIYFGGPQNALDPDLSVVACVAENSGAGPEGSGFFKASNEYELRNALLKIAFDIEERTRGFAAPIVPSVETTSEQVAYLSTFTPYQDRSIWRGHLRSYDIDPLTGLIEGLVDGQPVPGVANWDAGDTLSRRCEPPCPTNNEFGLDPRYFFFGQSSASGIPGTRTSFAYDGADTPEAAALREHLGTRIFASDDGCSPWPALASDPDGCNGKLDDVIKFTRGAVMQFGSGDPAPITSWGRDPRVYGWCGITDNVCEDPLNPDCGNEPCQIGGATLYGVEKLGDIFHSTPQLMGAPRCFACWFQNYKGYRQDDPATLPTEGFFDVHKHRRQVLFAGADDGSLHAFDAGLWDNDGNVEDDPQYDKGTGRELFSWVPEGVMDTLNRISEATAHEWTVDGTVTVADVNIDVEHAGTPVPADREWRSLVMVGQRDGGRSYTVLDVTQPDVYGADGEPVTNGDLDLDTRNDGFDAVRDPVDCIAGCTDINGNNRKWPAFRFEFTDTSDEDGGGVGNGALDLGLTWSRPLVGFVRVVSGTGTDDRMVAFFGGGFSPYGLHPDPPMPLTGNFVYGVDLETGQILLKVESDGMVPGEVVALDLNLDGFLEILYWADTGGNVYHMNVTTPAVLVSGRVSNWTPVKVFAVGPDQPFFMRPTLVPVTFNADGTAVLAVLIGSGNRDNILETNLVPHRFYAFKDALPATDGAYPIVEADLYGFDLVTIDDTGTNYLQHSTYSGWYLSYSPNALLPPPYDEHDDWEKTNTTALVVNQYVIFSTLNPSSIVDAVPLLDENGQPVIDPNTGEPVYLCRRNGAARTYVISLLNGNPPEGETDRFVEHEGAVMATEPVVYLGADGQIHIIQALDNLHFEEPMAAFDVPVRVLTWKEE